MKRVLITRARPQADEFAEALRLEGFEPVLFPVIEIQPIENNVVLEQALSKLNHYDWVIFTSANAVDIVFNRYSPLIFGQNIDAKFAAVGPKTSEALQSRGITPDYVPVDYVAESILLGLGDVSGKQILLPQAEMARKALANAIVEAGGIPDEISVYKTLHAQPDPKGLAALQSGLDVITFTSPSAVQNFAVLARSNELDPLSLPGKPMFVCIGPITEQAARKEGFINLVVAREYTTNGLIEAIKSLHEGDLNKKHQ